MKVVIIGAGVIGLSCAYYLQNAGCEVIVLEQNDGNNNCSFGNAGYISPSHFIPLASPGIVAQGLKWMLNSTSPFYIKPRLNYDLLRWSYHFYKNANETIAHKNAVDLNNILQLSRQLTMDLSIALNQSFQLETKGCLMLYQREKTAKHEADLAVEAQRFNLDTQILSKKEVQLMESNVQVNVLGGVYYPIDCHLHPGKLMNSLKTHLLHQGVTIINHEEVKDFEVIHQKVHSVITNNQIFYPDHIVVASGSWLDVLSKKLGIDILLQAGKGYSTTYENLVKNLLYPAILVDDRVALTPFSNALRVGGTMELSGINHTIDMKRIFPMIQATNRYYPDLNLEAPQKEKVWSGLRPCSPDGLPYIGNSTHLQNVTIVGGHAMLGISLAAASGHLVKQLIFKEKPCISMEAFRINRY